MENSKVPSKKRHKREAKLWGEKKKKKKKATQ